MKNSNLNTTKQDRLNAGKIINDFKNSIDDLSDVKSNLLKIFMGFFTSEDLDHIQRQDRESISYHFSRVMTLIDEIELCEA